MTSVDFVRKLKLVTAVFLTIRELYYPARSKGTNLNLRRRKHPQLRSQQEGEGERPLAF
jgi:hypothetical protein